MEIRVFDIPGYEGEYVISENGQVWNKKTGAAMHGSVNSHGYMVLSLTKNGKKKDRKLHRLLATTFIPNPNGYECVNHKDGNKLNNKLDNLEWCTKGYNNRHAREELDIDFTAKPVCQKTLGGSVVAVWANQSVAAKSIGITPVCIARCCEGLTETAGGYRWEHAAEAFRDFVTAQRKEEIRRKIADLTEEMERL